MNRTLSGQNGTSRSAAVLENNQQWIPGGVVSLNRKVEPNLCFSWGEGSRVRDVDGNEYIDYQAGFSAYFLGHNDPDVNAAVLASMQENRILMGAGPTDREGELAALICTHVPSVDKVQITNTGSEATYHAIRIARSHTGRDDIIIMQGGYNGWHNDVAANVISDLKTVGPRVSPGEYPFDAISAGIPDCQKRHVHVINYNDLASVEYVAQRHPIACIILEPILQNIGVVKPKDGYLAGLRALADKYGFLLIFDEVKTGFRHAVGGYQSLCGVQPDLSTFGKAVANGYPIGIIGGRADLMDYFQHPDPKKRVLIAGTYNAHPIPLAAAIATIRKLLAPENRVYEHTEELGQMLEEGTRDILNRHGIPHHYARQGSASCLYFMDHPPVDFHDVAAHHDSSLDRQFRQKLITRGVYQFPLPMKQASISFAHTEEDIALTLEAIDGVFADLAAAKKPVAPVSRETSGVGAISR
jgi:glutamate-1-semialdehyde 2,1-aminomutase